MPGHVAFPLSLITEPPSAVRQARGQAVLLLSSIAGARAGEDHRQAALA